MLDRRGISTSIDINIMVIATTNRQRRSSPQRMDVTADCLGAGRRRALPASFRIFMLFNL